MVLDIPNIYNRNVTNLRGKIGVTLRKQIHIWGRKAKSYEKKATFFRDELTIYSDIKFSEAKPPYLTDFIPKVQLFFFFFSYYTFFSGNHTFYLNK